MADGKKNGGAMDEAKNVAKKKAKKKIVGAILGAVSQLIIPILIIVVLIASVMLIAQQITNMINGIKDGWSSFWNRDGIVVSGSVIWIQAAGIYHLSGDWNGSICVQAGNEDKVKLRLEGVSIQSQGAPAIQVQNADMRALGHAERLHSLFKLNGQIGVNHFVGTPCLSV